MKDWAAKMLAERREKKKWSVDPNGTNWSRDTNKFGNKMLEKMGWTQGKGLGANEDGCTEHIKVKKKSDLRGLGCSVKEAHSWVAHQDDFSSLLAQLNSHHADEKESGEKDTTKNGVSNLEKHSKSQKRVHYHKFTRGKDLSNYKEDDLSAIFGKAVAKSAPATPVNLSDGESSGRESSSSVPEKKVKKSKKKKGKKDKSDDTTSNHITSTMSVQEYFAKRMALLKTKMQNGDGESNELMEEETTIESKVEIAQSTVHSASESDTVPAKSKKKKKKKNYELNEEEEVNQPQKIINGEFTDKKKKSKLKSDNGAEDANIAKTASGKKRKKLKKRKVDADSLTAEILPTKKVKQKRTE